VVVSWARRYLEIPLCSKKEQARTKDAPALGLLRPQERRWRRPSLSHDPPQGVHPPRPPDAIQESHTSRSQPTHFHTPSTIQAAARRSDPVAEPVLELIAPRPTSPASAAPPGRTASPAPGQCRAGRSHPRPTSRTARCPPESLAQLAHRPPAIARRDVRGLR